MTGFGKPKMRAHDFFFVKFEKKKKRKKKTPPLQLTCQKWARWLSKAGSSYEAAETRMSHGAACRPSLIQEQTKQVRPITIMDISS